MKIVKARVDRRNTRQPDLASDPKILRLQEADQGLAPFSLGWME